MTRENQIQLEICINKSGIFFTTYIFFTYLYLKINNATNEIHHTWRGCDHNQQVNLFQTRRNLFVHHSPSIRFPTLWRVICKRFTVQFKKEQTGQIQFIEHAKTTSIHWPWLYRRLASVPIVSAEGDKPSVRTRFRTYEFANWVRRDQCNAEHRPRWSVIR